MVARAGSWRSVHAIAPRLNAGRALTGEAGWLADA